MAGKEQTAETETETATQELKTAIGARSTRNEKRMVIKAQTNCQRPASPQALAI
jgi:hypothetical protein